MTRATGYDKFVDRIEARLNALQTLTVDVDSEIDEQIARRAEDRHASQSVRRRERSGVRGSPEARRRDRNSDEADSVAAQVATLKQDVEQVETRIGSALRGEAELASQERRIAAMLESVWDWRGRPNAPYQVQYKD